MPLQQQGRAVTCFVKDQGGKVARASGQPPNVAGSSSPRCSAPHVQPGQLLGAAAQAETHRPNLPGRSSARGWPLAGKQCWKMPIRDVSNLHKRVASHRRSVAFYQSLQYFLSFKAFCCKACLILGLCDLRDG